MSNTYSQQENFFQQSSQQQGQGPNLQSKRKFPEPGTSQHQPYFTPKTPIEKAATNYLTPMIVEHKRELYPDYKSQIKIEGTQYDFQNQGHSGFKQTPAQQIHSNTLQGSQQKAVSHQFVQTEQVQFETYSNYKMNPQNHYSQQVSSQLSYQVPCQVINGSIIFQSAVSDGSKSQQYVQQMPQESQGHQGPQMQQVINPLYHSVIDIPSDVKAKHSKRITKLSQYPDVFQGQSQILGWMSKNKDPNYEIKQSQNAIQNPIQQSAQKSNTKGCPDKENDI
ncbi:hypothetical protein pb186bvf_019665 [Paramecium bursaria]